MKKIILLLLVVFSNIINGQNLESNWIKVIEYENAGKIKSANKEVESIYKKANSNKNEVEIIKCFFYKSKYLQTLEENSQLKIITNLELEIKKASLPSKAILNYIYAKCLKVYLNKNSYNLQKRTRIDSVYKDTFLTWTSSDFYTKIDELFDESIIDETILKNTPLRNYEPIFDFLTNENIEKTTLYDYLVLENIDHFKTRAYPRYSYNKEIGLTNFLGSNADFLSQSTDSIYDIHLKKIINLFKKISSKEINEVEFNRLKFCNEYVVKDNKKYTKSLNNLQKRTKDNFLIQKIQMEKFELLKNNANKETNPQSFVLAIGVLDSIINNKTGLDIIKIAQFEKKQIEQAVVTIRFQKNGYENENIRAFLNYKNVDTLKVIFYKTNNKAFQKNNEYRYNKNELKSTIQDLKPYKTENYIVKNNNDYFSYSTEIVFPKLDIGTYIVAIQPLNSNTEDENYSLELITISNNKLLAYKKDTTNYYQVLNRKTGKPIPKCKIVSDEFELLTDENGNAQYKEPEKSKSYNYRNLNVYNDTDSLYIDKEYMYSNNNESNKEKTAIVPKIYLDRGIYRPGQKVFYKIIIVQNENNTFKIVPNLSIKIIIEDVNNETVQEINATTNEFGSVSGEFNLPKNGLTGDYQIKIEEPDDYEKDVLYDKIKEEHPIWDNCELENTYFEFSVEEYKRPKFEVIFEDCKETFTLNEKAFVKGNAKAYSNSSISDAIVKYTVNRFNYSTNTNRNYNYNYNNITIKSGETKTDSNGNFTIDFDASTIPDFKVELNTIYRYKISVNVTDLNGETHSASTMVKIGNQTTILSALFPQKIQTKDATTILLNSTNLNDQFKPVIGEIKIYFLKPFENKFKKRVFEFPEIYSISKAEFETLFPYEIYSKEIQEEENKTLLLTKKINTEKDKSLTLDFIKNYKSGNYKLVFTATDDKNIPSEITSDFEIIQSNDEMSYGNDMFTIEQVNNDPKKDGFALVNIKSAIPGLYINFDAVFDGTLFYNHNSNANGYQTLIKVPLDKAILDTFRVKIETFFDNQYFSKEADIVFKKIELEKMFFETESFRNKLEPGIDETWSFKIKNYNKSDFEVLASMYDSSLDIFRSNTWNRLTIEKEYHNYFNDKTYCYENPIDIHYYSKIGSKKTFLSDEKTNLMWFGFNFNNSTDLVVIKEYKKQVTKKAKKPKNSKAISGIVKDSSGTLPGANIVVVGTTRSAQTDVDGYYEIVAAPGETLVFSFIGLQDKSVKIEKINALINVVLKDEAGRLDEVLITGALGIKKRKEAMTSSQQVISAKELIQSANSETTQTLIGKVSGLQIETTKNGVNPTSRIVLRGNRSVTGNNEALIVIDGVISNSETLLQIPSDVILDINVLKGAQGTALYGVDGSNGVVIVTTKKGVDELNKVKTRTNRNETAFFFPSIRTDKNGKFSFKFTTPEELTQWKLQLLAHNKNAEYCYNEKITVTQKELMIFPNMPRFLRENDTISISAKVSNLTTDKKTGMAILQLFDATTMENIDTKMLNTNAIKNFSINPSGNTVVNWKITIPVGLQGIQYKVIAKSGDYSDGEESILPVVTNSILVTESIPVWVRENTKKEYTFDNLKNNTSTTLRNHQFTFEYTSNPTWLAIQSLPYLMEYEHECAEQTFARYYANVLATEIINSNPKIKTVFENWKKSGKSFSKLEQNEELKSLILAETPWLKDAENEEEKRKNLALLFDLETMKASLETTFKKLKEKQKSSGGFAWFDGGNENEYITRHIVAGLGHLQKLKVNKNSSNNFSEIIDTAIPFLDTKFLESNKNYNNTNPYIDLHYLYARTFYLDSIPITGKLKSLINKQLQAIDSDWLSYSTYNKAMAAIVLYRLDEKEFATEIIESLKETASNNEDWGMYWIENKSGWNWYEAPIETQALLIEAFSEITNDIKSIDAMKVWLLKNKLTKNWPTTKATTEAVYALLLQGTDWLSVKDNTIIKIGDEKIVTKKLSENEKEAETGYIKMNWKAEEINTKMATITIENKSKVPGFGGVYWQYFEDSDKIKSNLGSVLSTSKELYLKVNNKNSEELKRINSNNPLKFGDLVTVRIIISAKEDVEYIHLKDMRASCFEPINVLSEYKWNDGLGYYMSTKDAATHFFFDSINKGTYVIEYDIRVNNSGDFSNGITTIESMYAPEFTSHTKGIRVNVKE